MYPTKKPKILKHKKRIRTLLTPLSDGYSAAQTGTPDCCISDLSTIWQNKDLEIQGGTI